MTKKEKFINEINSIIQNQTGQKMEDILSPDALSFWNSLEITSETSKPKFTENGKNILLYMQDNKDNFRNLFKAKDIGEGLNVSSRTASGALRKLISDGYVERIGEHPIVYSITDLGINTNPNEYIIK